MDKKLKLVWLSDLDLAGSGYANLSVPICSGLIDRGHEVVVIGLGYGNQEHDFPFALLPAQNLRQATASALNLQNMWKADVLIVALDIPLQEQIINQQYLQDRKMKYINVF